MGIEDARTEDGMIEDGMIEDGMRGDGMRGDGRIEVQDSRGMEGILSTPK